MHWILLIVCCASVYGGMVTKSPVWMAVFFAAAVVSCAAWLWMRYTVLFPGGTAVTAGGSGLSDHEMERLRAHVRARAEHPQPAAPETLERPADPDAIRIAAQRVAAREAEQRRLREQAERAELAERAAEEQRVLEAARQRIANEDSRRALASPVPGRASEPEPEPTAPAAPPASAQSESKTGKPQGPEREVGEVWNPYAGAVQVPKKPVQVHPTSGDAHEDA